MVVQIFVDLGCFFVVVARIPLLRYIKCACKITHNCVTFCEVEVSVDDSGHLPVGVYLCKFGRKMLSRVWGTSAFPIRVSTTSWGILLIRQNTRMALEG